MGRESTLLALLGYFPNSSAHSPKLFMFTLQGQSRGPGSRLSRGDLGWSIMSAKWFRGCGRKEASSSAVIVFKVKERLKS